MIWYLMTAIIALVAGLSVAFIFYRKYKNSVSNGKIRVNDIIPNLNRSVSKSFDMENQITKVMDNLKKVSFVQAVYLLQYSDGIIFDLNGKGIPSDPEIVRSVEQLLEYAEDEYFDLSADNSLFHLEPSLSGKGTVARFYRLNVPDIPATHCLVFFYDQSSVPEFRENLFTVIRNEIASLLYINELSRKYRENYELMDNVFFRGPMPMCITDSRGVIVNYNGKFKEAFKSDQIAIESVLKKYFDDTLNSGDYFEHDMDFNQRFYKIQGAPLYSQDSSIKGGIFLFIDESLQRLLFNKLEISEKRYRKLIKKLPVSLAIINSDGSIYFVNDNFLQVFGFKDLSLVQGKNLNELFDIDSTMLTRITMEFAKRDHFSYRIQSLEQYGKRIFSIHLRQVGIGDEELIETVFQDITLETSLYAQLNEKNKLLEDELSTARVVQEHILSIPTIYIAGVRFNTFYLASHQLGGDFYDIIPIDDVHIGVVIADVSGHGVSASLITSMLKILVEFAPKDPHKLDDMLNYLHSGLVKVIPEDNFITMFYGIINTRTYRMEYINCGHPFPIVYDEKTRETRLLEGMGFPLGSFKNAKFENLLRKVQLPESCKILFYTDGLLNYRKDDKIINFQDLKKVFKESVDLPTREILNFIYISIVKNSSRFSEDDISMLLLMMSKDLAKKKFLSIPSNVLEIDLAIVRIIEEITKEKKLGEEDVWKVYTALYESMINAVEHGNKFDVQKRVTVIYRIFDEWIAFRIRDEGLGFKYNRIPNPLDEENVLKPSGRGVYMVKKMMNKVRFNKVGNEITMFYHVTGE